MSITALGLLGFSSGIGAGCAVLALMSSFSAVKHCLDDV